ncbi:hypothetical protein [Nocardioides marmoraquaticus]
MARTTRRRRTSAPPTGGPVVGQVVARARVTPATPARPDRVYFQAVTFNPGGKQRARAIAVIAALLGRVSIVFLQEGGWLLRLMPGVRSSMRLLRPWRGTPIAVDTDRLRVRRVKAYKLTGRKRVPVAAAGPTMADPRYLVEALLAFMRGAELDAYNWHGTPSLQFTATRQLHAAQVRGIARRLGPRVAGGRAVMLAVDQNGLEGHRNFDPLRAIGLRFVAAPVATHASGRIIDGFWVSKNVQVHEVVVETGSNPNDHLVLRVLVSIPADDRRAR